MSHISDSTGNHEQGNSTESVPRLSTFPSQNSNGSRGGASDVVVWIALGPRTMVTTPEQTAAACIMRGAQSTAPICWHQTSNRRQASPQSFCASRGTNCAQTRGHRQSLMCSSAKLSPTLPKARHMGNLDCESGRSRGERVPSPLVSNELNMLWSISIFLPSRFGSPSARKARWNSRMVSLPCRTRARSVSQELTVAGKSVSLPPSPKSLSRCIIARRHQHRTA